jgi:hypothetical protein
MSDKPDPDKTDPEQIKGPGGMNMRELHELVKKSHARDQISALIEATAEPLAATGAIRMGQKR